MWRGWASFTVREMEVKATIIYKHTPDRTATIKYDNAKCWKGHRTTGHSYTAGSNVN